MRRRRLAAGGLALAWVAGPDLAVGGPPPAAQLAGPPARVERTVFLMGTRARFVTEAGDRARGLARLERMVRVVEAAEAELSTWRADSVLGRLNRQPLGAPFALPPAVCDLLRRVAVWRAETGGAFDPAIGRLTEARRRRPRAPPAGPPALAAKAGFGGLALDGEACRVTRRADVTLDAGAFGKGEALDRVRHLVRGAGAGAEGAWLVDFGGQVAVSGPGAAGAWPVAIAHPERRGEPALDLRLASGSLATSAAAGRAHILDPRSGRTLRRPYSVTVWRADAFSADVLSTALYVMGVDAGLAWAEAREVAAAYLVAEPSGPVQVRATPAFASRFLARSLH